MGCMTLKMLTVENKINNHCNTSCKITALQISLNTIKFSEKGKKLHLLSFSRLHFTGSRGLLL
jgi:hypothetical protein